MLRFGKESAMKRFVSIIVSWALVFLPVYVQALPKGQQVVNGDVSFNSSTNQLNITASNKAIINYSSFNIAKNEAVNFIQPSINSVVLNRVISSNPSSILGSLNANGKVFLINPAGIVFGASSSINTNSFLATTLDIKDSDFLNEKYLFKQNQNFAPSYILQRGKISVNPDGFIVLTSPFVKQEGVLLAKTGNIAIGAVNNFYINFDSLGLIKFDYNPSNNLKQDIVVTKEVAEQILQDVVNNPKIKEAVDLVEKDGVMMLVGGSGTLLTDGKIQAKDIDLESDNFTGLLNNAKIESTGGDAKVYSQGDNFSSKNAHLIAKDGIFELSAKRDIVLDGSYIDAKLFYMDPENLTISSDLAITGNYFAEATKSIILQSDKSISTNGGDITFEAPDIILEENSKLSAGNGDITLDAHSSQNANIEIKNGVDIYGGDIKINSVSYRQSEFDSDSDSEALRTLSNVGDFIIDLPLTPIAYKEAITSSAVEIGNADINGKNIYITSKATSDVSVSALFKIIALSYGKSYATSTLHVNSGAVLKSDGDMILRSEATSKNHVSSRATNILNDTDSQQRANIAIAYSNTKAVSTAIIDSAVDITANKFELTSVGNKDISTSAAGASFSAGTLGTAVSISKSTSDIKSNLSGNIKANSIKVTSETNIERIKTSSSASVGNGFAYKYLLESNANNSEITNKTKEFANSNAPKTNSKSSVSKIALSAAFSYSKHENNSEAKISNATINANGNVEVSSNIIYGENGSYEENGDVSIIGDRGIKTVAIATIDSTDQNTKGNSFSGAVVLSDITNNSDAFIDDGVVMDMLNGDIGVYSKIYLGYRIVWSNIENLDTIKDIVPKVEDANFRGRLFTSYAQSNAQGTKNSLSGSYNDFKLTSNTDAHIGKNVSINQNGGDGGVEVLADNDIEALNFSGVIGWTYFGTKAGSTGIGGSYLNIVYSNDTKAYIDKETKIKATDVKVAAIKRSNNLSVSTAGGSSQYAISGSFSFLKSIDNTYAYINGADIVTSNGINNKFFSDELDTNLRVNAQNRTEFSNATGGVIKSKNIGVGASGSINEIHRDTQAYIKDSTISRSDSVLKGLHYIKAYNSGFINSYALSGVIASPFSNSDSQTTSIGGGVYGFGLSGDSSINRLYDSANAYIDDSTFNEGAQKVKLLAKNSSNIGAYSGAGVFNFSKKSVGLAGSYAGNYFDNQAKAYIENSTLQVGALDMKAQNSGGILALSGSGSISGGIASLAGSVSINEVTNSTEAYISNSTLSINKDLDIESIDDLIYKYFAGALGVGKTFGLGLSFGSNTVNSYIGSHIEDSAIKTDNLYAKATQEYEILGISSTPSVALSSMAVAGSYSSNHITNTIQSSVSNTQIEANNLSFNANDDSKIEIYSGTLSGSSSAGIGASGAKNEIANDILVYADDLKNKTAESFGSLSLEALSTKKINMASVSGSGAGSASVAGGVLINSIQDTLNSKIINSAFIVDNSAKVTAIEQNKVTTYGGTLSGAGSLGIGGSIVTNKISNTINSYIENSSLEVLANNFLEVPQKDSNDYSVVEDFYGLYLLALANEDLTSYVANASGSGTASFSASANFSTFSDNIRSYLKNSNINQNSQASNQSLTIRALAHNNQNMYSGGLAMSGVAGIGGSLTRSVSRVKTESYIENSLVNVEDLAEVRSESVDRVNTKTVSGSGAGTVALAGSVSIIDMQNSNSAKIVNGSIVKSGDSVKVVAKDKVYLGYKDNDKKVGILAGASSLGGSGGVGGSVIINNIKNSSYAHIDNSDVSAKDLIYLYAYNYSKLANYAVSGNLGGFAGSGAIVINTIDSTTKAYTHKDDTKSIKINQDNNYVTDYQDLHIEAADYVNIDDKTGSFSLGIGGVGGSINVTTLKNDTQAYLGMGTEAFAKKNIDIKAGSTKNLDFVTASGSGGALGVSGALMILNAGSSIDQDVDTAKTNTDVILEKTVQSLQNAKLGTFGNNRQTEMSNELSNANYSSVFDINPALTNKTEAYINDYARVNAGETLNVKSSNIFEELNINTGGVSGGVVGIGGAVSLVYIGADSKSFIDNGSEVDFKDLIISSLYDVDNINVKSYAGKAGAVSLGADYTRVINRYETNSYIGDDTTIVGENSINIDSSTKEDILTRGYGAGIGAAVAGYSKAQFYSQGSTASKIGQNSKIFTKNGDIDINSKYHTYIDSYAIAAALGAISSDGVNSDVEIKPEILTNIKNGTEIGAGNDLNILSASYDKISSRALGVKLSAVSVGASVSKAYNRAVISSIIDDNTLLNANSGSIRISTYENMNSNGERIENNYIYSKSTSAAGNLIGGLGSKSIATSHSHLKTYIGKDSVLNAKKYTTIKTKSFAKTDADVSGDSVGLAAAGYTTSYTSNDGDLFFTLDEGAKILSGDNILIKNYAKKNALSTVDGGVGGLLSGSGTNTYTSMGNINNINIEDGTKVISKGDVNIKATNNMYVNSYAYNTAVGFVSADSVKSEVKVDKQEADIDIGDTNIVGDNVNIEANVDYLYISSEAYSKTIAAGSYSRSYAYLTLLSTLGVNISNGADIIGYDSVNIEANQHTDDVFARTTATTTISASVVGKLYATVSNNPTFNSNIKVDSGAIIESDNINIKGSSPNMRKPEDYPDNYNYVKYPHIVNHSIAYKVEKKVWEFLDGFWQWVTHEEIHHKSSFSTKHRYGYFKSKKSINIEDNSIFKKSPSIAQKENFEDDFGKKQTNYFHKINLMTLNGQLGATRIPKLFSDLPGSDEVDPLLGTAQNDKAFVESDFEDEDFEDITDTKESKIVEDYMPNLEDLLMQSLNEKFIIIDNRLLGGKLFEQYLNLMSYKSVLPNAKQPIKKVKDKNSLISL